MSFGFGVGDFIAVGNLAWNIYRSCKGMSQEYLEVSREALVVHTLIKELQDEADDPQSILNRRGIPRKQELLRLIQNLQQVLEELESIVKKYQALGRIEKRILNSLRMSREDLDELRSKMTFHVTAINAFTASLSRSTEAQIETVLIEFVKDCREGRVPPNMMSVDEANNASGWKALERELTEGGISGEDVSAHKTAIKIFLLGRLNDTLTDNRSFDEVASIVESSSDKESISESLCNPHDLPSRPSRVSTSTSIDRTSFLTVDSEQTFQSALENFSVEGEASSTTAALRVSFAPSTRLAGQVDPRLQQAAIGTSSGGSIYRYRHSLDVSYLGQREAHMVLIIDPTHSCMSKLSHAYLRSITKSHPIVGEQIDTVRSTGWQMHKSGGPERLLINTWTKELLSSKKVEIPPSGISEAGFGAFRFHDMLQFDHIIYLDSPTFRTYLEDNIQRIARIKYSGEGFEFKQFARLTKFDLPAGLQLPERMQPGYPNIPELFERRQKLALEEIFKAVKRFMLDFLDSEYGLKRKGQGFEKVSSRRPSRSSSLNPLGRDTIDGSNT